MHIHILGVCGTFMGGLAQIAKQLGHKVTGSDANVYPPMSDQLIAAGIDLIEGFNPDQLDAKSDLVVVGNAMSRGNPCVERILNEGIPYTSGPQWLGDNLLRNRWVLSVAGTHGKTTTSSMLAWVLEFAGFKPGFLIGGVPENFGVSARIGESDFFVIEADEYDSAFFDKRSKFVHYHSNTLLLNNLEFDHADIFRDLEAIKTQFHHAVRTVPAHGMVISPSGDEALDDVLNRGCWSTTQSLGQMTAGEKAEADWQAELINPDGSAFDVYFEKACVGRVEWSLLGMHNVSNALGVFAAARSIGILPEVTADALGGFESVKRRLEVKGQVAGVTVYDDFAHHPTAIRLTLEGVRSRVGEQPVIAVLEPRSNTMKMGVHNELLEQSVRSADRSYWFQANTKDYDLRSWLGDRPHNTVVGELDDLVKQVCAAAKPGTHIVCMSNGSFGGIHQKLLDQLAVEEVDA
ncbi:UDP-N-acetylmuramate:L-alanyl-gamma-D-glutamyl-meso-diaminopimelate ligase [Litoribacillus peritrichatus]|uniref:UDP-N-acetylmuramate--L-alanyl-gamma-D-glutamyl-meso-2,6-diaminoheptandioate ligase n=1 Tax=Litoribacillus peritrichatus TaxID=718191 RepID=A0ABP7N7P6_9GAMM